MRINKKILLIFVSCLVLLSLFYAVSNVAGLPTKEDIVKGLISGTPSTQTTPPATPTAPEASSGTGAPAQNQATFELQAITDINDMKTWPAITKGNAELLIKEIERVKGVINADKDMEKNGYQPAKLLALLDKNEKICKDIITLIGEANTACNKATPLVSTLEYSCQCTVNPNNGIIGKCLGIYSDMFCCASNNAMPAGAATPAKGTAPEKTCGTTESGTSGWTCACSLSECNTLIKTSVCKKGLCPGATYCCSKTTTQQTAQQSASANQKYIDIWNACVDQGYTTLMYTKPCCKKACGTDQACIAFCNSITKQTPSGKITGAAISGFAGEEFQLLGGPTPEGTTGNETTGKTTGTKQQTTIPEKPKVDPAKIDATIAAVTTSTTTADTNLKSVKKGADGRKQIGDILNQVKDNVNNIATLIGAQEGANPNAGETETGAPAQPPKPSFGCVKLDWSNETMKFRSNNFWPKVNASQWATKVPIKNATTGAIEGNKTQWNYPFTCAYQIAAGIYSIAQAVSLIRGSGSCSAETPIAGADYCESCNMPFTICTAERCKILGTACRAINKDNGEGVVCLRGVCEPTSVPVVDKMNVKFFVDRTKLWKNYNGQPVCPKAPPDVKAFTNCLSVTDKVPVNVSDIEINITLNQRAKCKYIIDKPGSNFSEMSDFEDNQYYPTGQIARIDVTQLELGQNHTMYIKCEGTCGQEHNEGFDWNFIRFEFVPKPDELPPVIVKVVPDPMTQYISSTDTNATIQVWLDEAGYCKYSHINETGCGANLTTNWSGMCSVSSPVAANVKSFKCNEKSEQCASAMNAEGEQTMYNTSNCGRCYLNIDTTKGYEEFNWSSVTDGTQIPDILNKIPNDTLESMKNMGMTGTGKVFTYMFRCADLANPENIMLEQDSYMYVIMTYPPFEMNITAPENNSDSFDREWTIKVNTTRPTECRYIAINSTTTLDWSNQKIKWENMSAVDEGMNTEHEGNTTELAPANYTLYIRCRDAGGLEQRGLVKFKVLLDNVAPIAIRLYKWEDFLYLETNELSECVYGNDAGIGCKYNFSDGNEMVGDMQYIHSAPWSLEHNYYIKCKDKWDNYPGGRTNSSICTTIISPYELPTLAAA